MSVSAQPSSETIASEDEVAVSVIQVNYTERRRADGTQLPVIHAFGRRRNGQLEHIRVHKFDPYFYAPENEFDPDNVDYRVTDHEPAGEDIRGREVRKIKTQLPRHVASLRDNYDFHDEADVLFPDRFLVDMGIKSGIKVPDTRDDTSKPIDVTPDEVEPVDMTSDMRINTFDIEVEDREGFPEDGEKPILTITSHDSELDAYIVWMYVPDIDERMADAGLGCEKVSDGTWVRSPNGEGQETLPFDGYTPIATDSDPDSDDYSSSDSEDEDFRFRIVAFDEEEKMLDSFISHIEETNPDILTGWNFDDFDVPYLLDRMEKLNPDTSYDLSADRFARVGSVERYYGTTIKGRVVFDMLSGYKATQFSEKESYRLDYIGELELDVGKEVYDGDIGDLWENDLQQLVEYNLRDVEIVVELNRENNIVNFWNEVRTFVGCRLEDATTAGDAVDMYILQKLNGQYILPSKGQQEGEDFEGGAVFPPVTGIRDYVSVLDLKSLYPMCMSTLNASPETKVDPEEYEGETYRAPNGIHFRKEPDGVLRTIIDELLSEREKKKALRNEQDPNSDEWELYDRQQGAIKVVMNSLYGVMGWTKFRLYDKDNASAVTATGRAVIEHTEKTVRKLDYDVIYGDTDSVMLEISKLSLDDISTVPEGFIEDHSDLADAGIVEDGEPRLIDEFREKYPDEDDEALETFLASIIKSYELEEKINNAYDDYAEQELNAIDHRFKIEAEKIYRRFFQAGKKKRYAGDIFWKEGNFLSKTDITGFETERSDCAAITNRVQKKVLEMLVNGKGKDEIRSYLNGVIEDFRDGEYPIGDVGIPGGIQKDLNAYKTEGAHVRGTKYANAIFGLHLGKGSKPKRVYLEKVHPKFFREFLEEHSDEDGSLDLPPEKRASFEEFRREPDVICYIHPEQIPDEFDLDWDKMLDKTLKGPVGRVIEPVGIGWDEVKAGQTQQGLGSYM